ncbi:hypothetical protein AB2M62_03445 [Sphingomonas sp. MMS12-HWE2-04]|uniref:hypothetical protein n=1 Tax=Sphingomonas sp. MMS12-HWE2-04 TaxID=3234199 RepID=UPI00384C7A70
MPKRWHLLLLALPPALFAVTQVQAQSRQSDAEAYPCGATQALKIVQRGTDFSIEPSAGPAAPGIAPLRIVIAVGRTLGFDRKILETLSPAKLKGDDDVRP